MHDLYEFSVKYISHTLHLRGLRIDEFSAGAAETLALTVSDNWSEWIAPLSCSILWISFISTKKF